MFLSASEIQYLTTSGELLIDPFSPENFKQASYILRLGNRWRNSGATQWNQGCHTECNELI